MDVQMNGPLTDTPRSLIRRAGYAEFLDPNTHETSYVRRLATNNFYPRFHVYLKDRAPGCVVSLHLDQKKPSYGVSHAHSGEYDGTAVERELARVQTFFVAAPATSSSADAGGDGAAKKGFFGRLFG